MKLLLYNNTKYLFIMASIQDLPQIHNKLAFASPELFTKSTAHLICSICYNISETPMSCADCCSNIICIDCLEQSYSHQRGAAKCPLCNTMQTKSKFKKNMTAVQAINLLPAFCKNIIDGCEFGIDTLESILNHEKRVCLFRKLDCMECKEIVVAKDYEEHRKTDCLMLCFMCSHKIKIS